MEDINYHEFFADLSDKPLVLLLGQQVLREYAGEDFFLTACKSRFDLDTAESYQDLISECGDSSELISIWHNISSRVAVPESLEKIASLPWNCVVTSAIHEVVERALECDWRAVIPVLNERATPSDPRSRVKLHVFKLFGCVTRDIDIEQPPFDEMQQLQRNRSAAAMLQLVPSLVTPQGTLLIDAVSDDDWMRVDTLCENLAQLGKNQTHFFGVTSAVESINEVQLLQRMGKLTLHRMSLGEAISQLSAEKFEAIAERGRVWREGVALTFPSGKKHVFTPSEWRRLTGGSTLLSDSDASSRYEFASADEKYRAFRDFLYGSHGVPDWRAICSGLSFRRLEFSDLLETVREQLLAQRINEEPILVCGQSGSGKSVALADLAVEIRSAGWPVLYFGRNQTNIDPGLVETISIDLERKENTSLLVIWDATVDVATYLSLAGYLASRGRKVVLVGTGYQPNSQARCVDFSPVMDAKEAARFREHLEAFDPQLVEGLTADAFAKRNFWAWLWRLLPETRGTLRVGLLGELETYEQELESSLKKGHSRASVEAGTLGALLAEAGIVCDQTDATEVVSVKDSFGKDAAQVERLTGLILVPGSIGQDVPVDLVLRCLGHEGFETLREALRSTSVFRWVEDEYGNYQLGARQQLEAVTIVNSRFGRSESFDFVKLLLRYIRVSGNWQIFNLEVDFALRLLRAVGPDNEYRNPTDEELIELADTLAEIDANSGHGQNPWLAFNEGHFRREALLRKRDTMEWNHNSALAGRIRSWIDEYQKATSALTRAETGFAQSSDRKLRRSMSRVHTEFAALYGLAHDVHLRLSTADVDSEVDWFVTNTLRDGFDEAVRHCKQAALFDSENPHTQDVRFRVTKTQLESDANASAERKVELLSDLCDVLDHSCWRHSQEQFNKRRLELAEMLDDEVIRREALVKLAKMGSTAGEYMLAWRDMFYPDRTWRPDVEIGAALKRIGDLEERVDLKLSRLYTKGWWQVNGKIDIYDCERSTVGLSQEQWEHYVRWLRRRLSYSEEESLLARFSYAWGLFQIGQYRESQEEFRILDRSTMAGRYRVIRLCLWSDARGEPVKCSGTIRRVSEETDKGWVYVPTLRRELTFRLTDFKAQTIQANQPLQDFHVAFNFRGPIADPARLYFAQPMPGGRRGSV